jgi:dTDP-4-amino-4,6-dideoxygalactose transaminase
MDYKIPLFDLNFDTKEEQAVIDVLKSKWISTGPKCQELEALFCDKLNIDCALTVSSCTSALHLAMLVLDINQGDEVIVPSLTFAATVNVVKYVGATPVFADIKSNIDLTIDPIDIEKKITQKTKAIIVMHYGGFPCNMDAIMKIAERHNLKVIEDSSHAPLSDYNGKKVGTIGDIGTFSFFSNKNISTGEGGMLVTNNKVYYQKAKLLRSHGMTTMSFERAKGHATEYDIQNLGYNFRMDDIRAAIGIVQFNKLQSDLKKRIEIRSWYIEDLKEISQLIIPFQDRSDFVSNYIFPIILKDSNVEYRDQFRNKLHQQGVQTSVHYPAVHRFSIYQSSQNRNLQNTEYVTDNTITLPMYSKLTRDDISYITNAIKKIILHG